MLARLSMDIKLIKEVLRGKTSSFKVLYERYSKSHLLICLRYMKNRSDAEDLLQESYIKIYRDLKQFDSSKAKYKTWTDKIVVNTCLMKLRKKNIFHDIENIVDFSQSLSINQHAIDNLNLQEITNLILQLPKGYRTVFNLYIIDGYKHHEIADLLGISVNTSKSQLMKAKKSLQDLILSRESSRL